MKSRKGLIISNGALLQLQKRTPANDAELQKLTRPP